jgi:hypothetical protein
MLYDDREVELLNNNTMSHNIDFTTYNTIIKL